MKTYKMEVERTDLEFDKDQPTWYGEVLANDEDEAKSVVLKLMDDQHYSHEVTKIEEIGEEEDLGEDRIAGVLTGGWEY